MAGAVVELEDLTTHVKRKAKLVGFDIKDLGTETLSTVYGYISRKAETDLSLPRDDCNTLRYTAVGSSKVQDVIVDRLMVYGDLVESVVEANKDIRESDDAVIRSACHASEEGGGEEGIHGTHQQTFNFRVIQDHLLIVLQRFFSRERVMNNSATRLLIDFAIIIKYCYGFLTRLVHHAREVLREVLPQAVFDILCHVTSAIFIHLAKIQWLSVLKHVGGWVGLASTTAIGGAVRHQLATRPMYQELISHGESHDNRVREFLKAYNHVISTRATIELPFLKIVFIGAPRLGKTTMRRRLTRVIDDIFSAGEAEQPSTGIVESEHNVIIRNLSSTTTIVTSSEWSLIKDISEEVRMLFQFISQTYDDVSPTEEKEASEITADDVHLHREPKASVRSTDLQDNVKPLPASTTTSATGNEASSSNKDPIISDEDLQEFLSTDNWEEEIKYLLENTALLSMSDVGGQPEFMDMQPALVLGPALYLVFCNLSQALKEHYSVSYLHSSGGSTKPDKSFYTVEEVIFQALSAITCLGKVDPVTTSVDPETSAALPTTSIALPTTSAALPTTSAALPTTSAALPTTSAALPTTSAALPTTSATSAALPTTSATSAALPTTSAALPTTSAALPTTSAALPTTSAALPTTSTAVPTTSAALPTTSAALPTTSAAVPTASTALTTYSTGQPPSNGPFSSFSSHHLTLVKSKAMIVGTHRDLVSEDKVKEFDRDLQRKIRATDFFKDDIVQFATEDRLVLEVDNMKGGLKEVRKIQKIIEDQMKHSFKKLSLPVSWLIFSLCLRKKASRMVSLQSCLDLAQQLNIPPDEAKLAMWFLHHYAGLLMHFPDLPELSDSVICDTQIVYDSVTHLIVNTYKFDNVSVAALEKFRDTGQFSLQDIKKAVDKDGTLKDYIPLNKLVQLLKYLNIIVPVPQLSSNSSSTISVSPSKEVYFMPCVLQNAPSAELKVSSVPDQVQPIPLMIRFTCGFVPTGVFTAMIANLVGQNSESLKMIVKGIKKNRVQFHYGVACEKVTVVSKPKHYEIHISRLATARTPTHEVCTAVRDLIKRTLKSVASRFNYTFSLSYQFAFECPLPEHGGGDHLCVVKEIGDAEPEVMTCRHDTKEDVPVGLQDQHLVWFGKPLPEVSNAAVHCTHQASSSVECRVLVMCHAKLVAGLESSVSSLSDKCYSKFLISEDTRKAILELNLTNSDKTAKLLLNVKETIKQRPEKYEEFVGVLAETTCFEHLVEELRKERSHLCKEHPGSSASIPPSTPPSQNSATVANAYGASALPASASVFIPLSPDERESASNVSVGDPILPSTWPSVISPHRTSVGNVSGGVPTLREFIKFPMSGGRVNLAQEIGTNYTYFGKLLLKDDNGNRTDEIVRELEKMAEDINKRIFRLWVKGEGLQPVSWATLVSVLHDMGLNTLARDVEHVKCPKLH